MSKLIHFPGPSLKIVSKLKKIPTKCSPMHVFKKIETFGHSPKRQAIFLQWT